MTVRLERNDAERILSVLHAMDAANAHYKSCQSVQFRTFAMQQLSAPSTVSMTERLTQALEQADKIQSADDNPGVVESTDQKSNWKHSSVTDENYDSHAKDAVKDDMP